MKRRKRIKKAKKEQQRFLNFAEKGFLFQKP
jgi:hypothetical protein